MKTKEEYIRYKQMLLNNRITEGMFPYLFEYYTEKLIEKECTPLVQNEEEFRHFCLEYLRIPVMVQNGSMMTSYNTGEELVRNCGRIFQHLDKKYL